MPTDRGGGESTVDRGVSEVVGFVLVFALVALVVGVVSVAGFGGLTDVRNAERVDNAERAFDVLADNLADVYRDGAPSRETEIKLADATLSLGEPTTMRATVEDVHVDDNSTKPLVVYESTTRPLVFSTDTGPTIVYEGGAVIRTERHGAVLLREPPFLLAKERTVVPYVVLSSAGGTQSIGGDATVLVRGVKTGQAVLLDDRDADVKVTLTVRTATARTPVWEQYVNEQADWSGADWSDADPDTPPCETTDLGGGRSEVVCTFEPDEFYLTSTGIQVHLVS